MKHGNRTSHAFVPSWWKMVSAAVCLICVLAAIAAAQTLTTLYDFCSQTKCADGESPFAGLVQATDGNLHGTTYGGGDPGPGTVFKITPSGALTAVYSFCSQTDCTDGQEPYGAVVQGSDGNFYGTTAYGGNGSGTAFRLTPTGTLATLVSFSFWDGEQPRAALIQGSNGNFYGTTYQGGTYGGGEVFEVTPAGTLTILHSFCERLPCVGGDFPWAGLVQGVDGNFYGVTTEGGRGVCEDNNGVDGCGVVFKITLAGAATVLYSFCERSGCPDGDNPQGTLVQASDGNFYGTTIFGGVYGYGTVFRITAQGALTTLYSFCSKSNCADGAYPYAGLIQATDGNLYGTTQQGGAYYVGSDSGGTVFRITLNGTVTTLHSFCSEVKCADGALPYAPLVQDTNGTLYGTTSEGGEFDSGTVFSLSVGLHQFIEAQPDSGAVGAPVNILGTALEGVTSVTFNGTPASFTVSSNSLITTTVPDGATSGVIKATTPHGTVSSKLAFRELP